MVVSPLWRGPGIINGFAPMENPTHKDWYCSNTNGDRRFRYEDNNVAIAPVQPHFYCVRWVE